MIGFASPIYYFGMTAQITAATQRVYAMMKWPKATKAALLLSSMSPNVYDGAIATYKGILGFTGIEDAGVFTAKDPENRSAELEKTIYDFAKSL